jgi:hypothetical protein
VCSTAFPIPFSTHFSIDTNNLLPRTSLTENPYGKKQLLPRGQISVFFLTEFWRGGGERTRGVWSHL